MILLLRRDFNAYRSYWPHCNDMFRSRSDQAFLHWNFGAQARSFRGKSFCAPLRQSEDQSPSIWQRMSLKPTCPFQVVWTSVSYQNFLLMKSLPTWKRTTALLLKVLSNVPEQMGKSVPFTYVTPIWIWLRFPNIWNDNRLNNSFFKNRLSSFKSENF